MKKSIIITISAILAFGLYSCKNFDNPEKAGAANDSSKVVTGAVVTADTADIIQPVKIMPVTMQTIKRTAKVTATLVAEQETYLAPAIAGKIRRINVDVNDEVRKGQVLINMDKTQLSQTRIQYANLKKDLARMDTLLLYGSITQQAYDQMKTQVNSTYVMLKNLEENTDIKAPYSGVITGKYFNNGELFSPAPNTQAGKAAIVSMVKMDVLKVNINLSERYLPLVKEGQIATVQTEVYPADTFQAKVYRIYPTINAMTRTFTVELRMENPEEKLRPGMFSSVTLEMGDRDALLVPAIAVIRQAGTNNRYIFIEENGIGKKVQVQVGERLDDQLELIPNGIKNGNKLIYAGHVNLMDGDKVNVVD